MKTAVVILNWNTREYLRTFLPPLIASCHEGAEVIVADNGSTDGSLELLASEFSNVRVIALGENFGFTGGYNRALAQIDAEYFVLINSDIEVCDGWLEPLVDYMDAHPECGVCGPKLHALLKAPDGTYERSGRFEYAGAAGGLIDRFGYPFCRGRVLSRTENDEGQYDIIKDVMWVSGACLVTRSGLWKDLGGLDERFFAHMEEIDYCWRAQRSGHKVRVVPQSTVWHLGGGTLPQSSPFKLKLNYRNNLLMLEGNLPASAGKVRAALRIFFRKVLDGGSALVYLLRRDKASFSAVLNAHRESRKLSKDTSRGHADAPVAGYCERICILTASALKGEKIFTHLRKRYEDCY